MVRYLYSSISKVHHPQTNPSSPRGGGGAVDGGVAVEGGEGEEVVLWDALGEVQQAPPPLLSCRT